MSNSDAKQAFRVGDVVMLKSGGPKMTITYIPEDSNYFSVSFFGDPMVHSDGSSQYVRAEAFEQEFPAEALERLSWGC